jgi:methylisocitrate lyase
MALTCSAPLPNECRACRCSPTWTEFGKTPFFTAMEFEAMGYAMVIWPVSALRVANKAQGELYAAIARDGGTHKFVDRMQTRAELYATIGLHDHEALDASIVQTVIPKFRES